jgi:hypothetical protein
MEDQRAPLRSGRVATRRRRQVLVTPRDRLVLEMAAEHRLVLPGHVAALLGVTPSTARTRLRGLAAAGYLSQRRIFVGQPACFQITRPGLALIGSGLPGPHLDLSAYTHDVWLAWLWLAARKGSFGPVREVLSERTLRSRDGQRFGVGVSKADPGSGPGLAALGIRLGGSGAHGRARLHYPDLLLVTPDGRCIALELELSAKGQGRLDGILAGYGGEPGIDAVLYLVDRPAIAQKIRSSARRLGLSWLVHVQWIRQPATSATAALRSTERVPAGRQR